MTTRAFSAIVVKSLDEESRTIEGIATTPTLDRAKDRIKSEGVRYAEEIPLLLNHSHAQPVGVAVLGPATQKGIPFRARISRVDEEGAVKTRTDEAWHSVKAGLIKGVSIGFRPDEYVANSAGGLDFTKAEIHELSLVAIPCNPEAVITAFKSLAASEEEEAGQIEAATKEHEEAEASRKALDMRKRKLLLSVGQ